jgi:predicted metalloprotease with PDZ domain
MDRRDRGASGGAGGDRLTSVTTYRLRIADPNGHHFEIVCDIDNPQTEQRLSMPSWIPGSYLLREFARHVVEVKAESNGRPIEIAKIDKGSWVVRGAKDRLRVTLRVHALDLSVRGAYLDGQRAYFNGPCVFLWVHGKEREPASVWLEAPEDPRCRDWQVATSMQPVDVDTRGFGRYAAKDYDELIDHPAEISAFARVAFTAANIPHELVVAGRHDTDLERVAGDLRQLCETQLAFFGPPAPFERYVFLGLALDKGYGGLEHRSSSSLMLSADDLPKPGEAGVPAEYQRFLGLCSHEYFHSWNVKRLKPAAFMPYRLDRRNHTRLLWVFEGITSYYQDLLLLRGDLIGLDAYLVRLAQMLTKVYRAPGRLHQSLAEASFDAWDRLYKPEPNSLNATISYYTKGALVALALDLKLRKASNSAVGLDEVMTALWERFGREGVGLGEDDFERVAEELGGADLGEFFDLAVRDTVDLPLAELLADFAVSMELRASAGPQDQGGALKHTERSSLTLGAIYRDTRDSLELLGVVAGGPAESAGLVAGDQIVALDGYRVDAATLTRRLSRFDPGATVTITLFRRNELLQFPITLQSAPLDTVSLTAQANPDAAGLERRIAWLGS